MQRRTRQQIEEATIGTRERERRRRQQERAAQQLPPEQEEASDDEREFELLQQWEEQLAQERIREKAQQKQKQQKYEQLWQKQIHVSQPPLQREYPIYKGRLCNDDAISSYAWGENDLVLEATQSGILSSGTKTDICNRLIDAQRPPTQKLQKIQKLQQELKQAQQLETTQIPLLEKIYHIRGARILYCRDGDRRRLNNASNSIDDVNKSIDEYHIENKLFRKESKLIYQLKGPIKNEELEQCFKQQDHRQLYWIDLKKHDYQPYWSEDEMEQYWHYQIENLQNRYNQLHDPYRTHRIQRLIIELAQIKQQQQEQQRTKRNKN